MKKSTRHRVAEETARLLYYGIHKEYIHAKDAASKSLGVKVVPSNFEIAIELDKMADRIEGPQRQSRLILFREIALEIMHLLRKYNPVLTGSVWRGTARKNSDIDINAYSSNSNTIDDLLTASGYSTRSEVSNVVRDGSVSISTHINFLIDDVKVEIIVRPIVDLGKQERCGTYGDLKKGLSIEELEKVMQTDPLRRFIPKKKPRIG